MNVLTIDIGNSNTVLNLYENNVKTECLRLKSNGKMMKDFSDFILNNEFDKIGISSVVPKLSSLVLYEINKDTDIRPVIISKNLNTGLDNSSIPNELGSDLICNLINAHCSFPDKYVTVADFGTAFTTITVSNTGQFVGCTISPGVGTAVRSLFSNTAQIPLIDVCFPDSVFGKNTVQAVSSGIFYGFKGQLEGIIKKIEDELNIQTVLVITGGYSSIIGSKISHPCIIDLDFTSKGIYFACLMNN